MSKTEKEYRREIVDVGKLVYQKGWVAANDGNISIRLDRNKVLCTCTGISKGMMTPDDLIICDLDGNKLEGSRERTSEIAMHLTIYQMGSLLAMPLALFILHQGLRGALGMSAGRALGALAVFLFLQTLIAAVLVGGFLALLSLGLLFLG